MKYKSDNFLSLLKYIRGSKSRRWEYEEEVRVITTNPGTQAYDFRAVKSIYFGLRSPKQLKENIMEVLAGREIKYYQINLIKGTYQFDAKPVEDKYLNATKYLYKVAPVQSDALEGAINDYKHIVNLKLYLHYLAKAVEVARRDPYCAKVYYPAFKHATINTDHPEIFGNVERTDGNMENIDYSLEQIEKEYSRINDFKANI